MRVGASPYVPMVRRPVVRAGGGETAAAATPAPTPATPTPTSTPAQPTTGSGTFDIKSVGMKVQSFLSNIWDTLIGPFIKGLFGMFGG